MNSINKLEDNDDDLKGMAPHLFKMHGNNPFKANVDYFERFSAKIKNKISDFEEIKNEASFLSEIPKYNPFEVPKDYFDYLPSKVQENIIKAKTSNTFVEWLLLLIKPRFAFPFVITILIAVAGIRFMNNNAALPSTEVAEEISTEEQLYNIDEATIIESVNAGDNTDTKVPTTEDTAIQNYLIDNNVDENNL